MSRHREDEFPASASIWTKRDLARPQPPLEGEGRSEPSGEDRGGVKTITAKAITPPRLRFAPPTLPLKGRVEKAARWSPQSALAVMAGFIPAIHV